MTMFLMPSSAYAAYTQTIAAFEYNGYLIPAYDGDIYEVINGNHPQFTASELNQTIYVRYGALDNFGRVTTCVANLDKSLMPTGDRGDIRHIKPTGWQQKYYDFVDEQALYNRSHLIAWKLTGENANEHNLMTGTRSFNSIGMAPFENIVADYLRQNSAHNVLYRVTPVFQGDNLLASGVIMEGMSVDDLGAAVCFCVFVYNVENQVAIDYATGKSLESASLNIAQADIRLKASPYFYTGKAIEPLESVCLYGQTLQCGREYTVQYQKNVHVGEARVTVAGVGDYSGMATRSFTIVPPTPKKPTLKKVNAGKGALKVKWKKVKGVSGYQLMYATDKNFKKAKKINVSKASTCTKTIKKLKNKKTYYVRIRCYKTVAGKKFYSVWSRYKTVKIK